MTDRKGYAAVTPAKSGAAKLQVQCNPLDTDITVAVQTNGYLGAGFRMFSYRVDHRQPHEGLASYGKKVVDLLKPHLLLDEAKNGTNLLVRYSAFDDTLVDQQFGLTGLEPTLQKLRSYCPPKSPSGAHRGPVPGRPTHSANAGAPSRNVNNPCWHKGLSFPPGASVEDQVQAELRFRRCLD